MILKYGCRWVVTVLLIIPTVNLQIPLQVFQMPQMYGYPPPPPPPPPVAMSFPAPPPIAFQIVEIREPSSKNKGTTSNTENNIDPNNNNDNSNEKNGGRARKTIGFAIPMAFPPPVQFAVPAYPPPDFCRKSPSAVNCPVCPPCVCDPCTPSFFSYCSPCHQKCRCRNGNDAPIPLPHEAPVPISGPAYPMPIPGNPGIVYPVHKTRVWSGDSYENFDDLVSSSIECSHKKRHRKRKRLDRSRRKKHIHIRRRAYDSDLTDDDFAKPVLSYISNDGDVKLEKALSNDEAAALMDENQLNQRVQIVADEDSEKRQILKVLSNTEHNNVTNHVPGILRARQVILKSGSLQHMLAEGKKELVFKPPTDKKISNLSVSFQITK